jgi:hypothetical protein
MAPFSPDAVAAYLGALHGRPVRAVRIKPLGDGRCTFPMKSRSSPELVVRGDQGTARDAAGAIVELLQRRGWLSLS